MAGIYTQPITGAIGVEAQGTDAIREPAFGGVPAPASGWHGFYGGEPQDSTTLRALGTEEISEQPGGVLPAVATTALDKAYTSFELTRTAIESGEPILDRETGQPLYDPKWFNPIPADQLNERYGIEGRLKFTVPLPEDVAKEMNQRKREDILREDIIARREPGLMTGGVARFVAGLVGGLPGIVDPLNIAASFLPVVPEARAALWAARAGEGAFAQAGVRAGVGALRGAAGQTALTPLYYGLAKADQEDYGATDALLNIALGGVFGGGLHALIGRGAGREAEQLATTIERSPPETRESLLRGAVADMAEGRPVETPAEIAAAAGRPPPRDYMADYEANQARVTRVPYEAVPKEPERLASYLQREGGVRDEGGELAALDANRPGLRNAGGLALDEATLRAWQEGFLPGEERPEINTLLDHLDRDLRGNPVYREQDEFSAAQHREALARNSEIDRLSQEHDIAVGGNTQEQFYAAVAGKIGRDATAAEADRLAASSQSLMAKAAAEGWLPDFGESSPTTPEEIENAYRQETVGRAADPREGGLGQPQFVGRATRADEAGPRSGRSSTGYLRRSEPERPTGEFAADLRAEEARAPLDRLNDEIAVLERELGLAGERPAELAALDRAVADTEAEARAVEQSGVCLGRRL